MTSPDSSRERWVARAEDGAGSPEPAAPGSRPLDSGPGRDSPFVPSAVAWARLGRAVYWKGFPARGPERRGTEVVVTGAPRKRLVG